MVCSGSGLRVDQTPVLHDFGAVEDSYGKSQETQRLSGWDGRFLQRRVELGRLQNC